MGRTCTICTHERRSAMDGQMLRGERLSAVARQFGVSQDALSRHRKHQQAAMSKAATLVRQTDADYGSSLLAEIARIRTDAERLQLGCEDRRDIRGALRAIDARLSVVELEAKLSGQINPPQRNELHLHIPPDRALAIAEAYIARHGSPKPLPELEDAPLIDAQVETEGVQ